MLKKDIEALLFSAGRKLGIVEFAQITKSRPEEIKSALAELKMEYDEKNSSLMLANEGDFWKLTVREPFLPLVRKIVTETELSKTILETLAVIAFKYPIKQSDLIKIRTNKAYDHLKELEEMGYITRQKHGRTNLIKLTQRFFEYFDLPEEKVKEVFSDFSSIAKAIEEKEAEIKRVKEEQAAMAVEEKKKQEQMAKGIELEAYGDERQSKNPEEEKPLAASAASFEEKLGSLEVIDEPSEEELEKERERLLLIKEEGKKFIEEKKELDEEVPQEGGIELSPEEEKLVDDRVKNILHPKEENEESNKSLNREEPSESDEEKDLLEAEMEEEDKNSKKLNHNKNIKNKID